MTIKTFYFNPYRECTYIIYNEHTHARESEGICNNEHVCNDKQATSKEKSVATPCIIIDCGAYDERERQRLDMYIHDCHLLPVAHLITHAHPDHICGAEHIQEKYGLAPIIYPAEGELCIGIKEDTVQAIADIEVLRTPGHKEDCVCYYLQKENIIFTGDTLFQESIGRTDLPGGNMSELMTSLQRLATLPRETVVYPGHGYTTTIEHELQYNPYL